MDPKYDCVAEDGLFTMTFRAPRQLLLHPEFEQMVWDECLRQAHAAGHIPVGPIHIDTTADDEPYVETLEEGSPLAVHPLAAGGISYQTMKVSAQVQIGTSL